MKSTNQCIMLLSIFVLVPLLVVDGFKPSIAESSELSTAVFYVHWYDVGEAALEGLEGIKKIDIGFQNLKEINTVYYDSSEITIEEMEEALKKSGTYLGTAR